jgi:hypothetical protein
VDLNNPVTSVSIGANPLVPEYPMPPANLGDRAQGTGDSEWMFVQASATVSAFNIIAIDAAGKCANLTSTLLASGLYAIGIAEFQPAGGVTVGNANGGVANAGDFFWALLKAANGARLNVATDQSITTGSALYISTTAGRVTSVGNTSLSLSRLNGLLVVATATGTAGEVAMFNYIFPGGVAYASMAAQSV